MASKSTANTFNSILLVSSVVVVTIAHFVNAVPAPTTRQAEAKPALNLTILHNNDMHARFEQTNQYSTQCHPDEVSANKCYGGFARTSELIKSYRREAENGGPSVFYLNAGDTYTGTPWFALFKDKIAAEFMNILKPDAMSLGNHELDLGVDGLVPFLNRCNFPVLVANLNNSADHPLWRTRALKRSAVFDMNGFKVGVIGYLTPETKLVAVPNDLEFIPEVIAINEEAKTLKGNGVNIIFALGHSGYEVDKEIAKNCPLVDVVVGGHSNTFLYNGLQPDSEKIEGPYPTVIVQDNGKKVPVVQAYAYTKYLGKLDLSFDSEGNLLSWGGQPILLNSDIQRDPEVLALLNTYWPSVRNLTEQHVGTTKVFLDGHNCRATECNLGNLVTDALIYTRVVQRTGYRWTDASIALVQGGGIRSSATIGNITQYDMTTILPFNNDLMVVNVTGKILEQALERSVERYTGDRGEFLQMSGVRVVYNMSKPGGHRVESTQILCADCDVPVYEALDLNKLYGVIITSFIHDGGDDFTMFQGMKSESMGITYYNAVMHYIQDFHTVYPAIEGRITLNGEVEDNDDDDGTESGGNSGSAAITPLSFSLAMATVLLKFFL